MVSQLFHGSVVVLLGLRIRESEVSGDPGFLQDRAARAGGERCAKARHTKRRRGNEDRRLKLGVPSSYPLVGDRGADKPTGVSESADKAESHCLDRALGDARRLKRRSKPASQRAAKGFSMSTPPKR